MIRKGIFYEPGLHGLHVGVLGRIFLDILAPFGSFYSSKAPLFFYKTRFIILLSERVFPLSCMLSFLLL
ncbi:MAG: hypothetical protein EAX86_11605 [Candidatus Heimdallarchaeota archaeon]|nr:hypothetical protein [Candidatus Heimdallarchaeota archaeon]